VLYEPPTLIAFCMLFMFKFHFGLHLSLVEVYQCVMGKRTLTEYQSEICLISPYVAMCNGSIEELEVVLCCI